ncbi:4-hydroxybenzoate 3-monooxygenase [Saccharomonospora sp. NB11]|uniref:4-hydroxybenzoate 3-monooxygenase n=1 Tax=Saccharomonospora sp. NB11 TaxID=1642298 RepID=UPI0018D1B4F9|nr:4-hydroxybenzoate 3-monooxygenase [Saccharomonospora sp. NB11]
MSAPRTTTQVGIVGAGPAGLMLSHLLALRGIDSVVVDHRSRDEIERTIRAGILEADSVRSLTETGVSDRVLAEGDEHHGIQLAFGGESHRVDFQELVGASVWLYPQTEVFVDLANARDAAGGDVRFGVRDTSVHDLTATPVIRYTDSDGTSREVHCRYLVGADGSHSLCRHRIPAEHLRQYRTEYPFAWFGILCEAPKSAPELIYSHSERGFALISQRTETLQRMYFQCDPDEDVDDWSDDRIWSELQARVRPHGHDLVEGPVVDKSVLRFRSNVVEPMRYGNLLLAGDAAHTVPPTGAKGLNLALADVRILAEVLERALATNDDDVLDDYSRRALDRVWRAQHFSYWMTSMLHRQPGADDFAVRRQVAELRSVVRSRAGSTFLAEGYTGWPSP